MKTKARARRQRSAPKPSFGDALGYSQLAELAEELLWHRKVPPVIKKSPGRREGDVLGFVRGLRLSARLVYFLRDTLSHTDFDVNWGHVLDEEMTWCSPECDIVVHTKGFIRRWNGGERPIMDFCFIRAQAARVVVSCKSILNDIDKDYANRMQAFGVKKVFLFAECCDEGRFESLEAAAKKAGYAGLYCLYFTSGKAGTGIKKDELLYATFVRSLLRAVDSKSKPKRGPKRRGSKK